MKVTNLNQAIAGSSNFDISLEAGEVEFLVNLALDYLVDKEYINLNHEQEQYHIDLLNSFDKSEMFTS